MWLLGALLSACAVPSPRPPPMTGPPGSITIVVRDRLAWPFALDRVVVVLDGQVFYNRRTPLQKLMWVASLRDVPSGAHTVQTLVDASYQTGTVGQACHVTLRSAETFVVGDRGVSIAVDVHLLDASHDFPDRLGVAFVMDGASRTVEAFDASARRRRRPATTPVDLGACRNQDFVASALCTADVYVQHARREKDIVKVYCYADKQTQMESAARLLATTQGELEEPERAEHARLKIQVLRERIAVLVAELDQCVGESELGYAEPRMFRIVQPGCTGTEPLRGNTTLEEDWGTPP